jgi:hypothetical protein
VQTSIEAKLTALLADPIDTEAKAVYVLCQVRTLQDYDSVGPNRLRMCSWAVHVELEARATVELFLQHIDDVVGHKLAGVLTVQILCCRALPERRLRRVRYVSQRTSSPSRAPQHPGETL